MSSSLADLPPIVGDPGGMRALAAQLRSLGASAAGQAGGVVDKAKASSWSGPAADEFRTTLAAWIGDVTAAGGALVDAAAALESSATEVEGELAARARLERLLLEDGRR
jgi:uncharacterized protein YukE